MKKVSHRLARVADSIHHEVARLLLTEINDPRVKGITLTRVKMAADLRLATIYFSVSAETDIAATTQALNHTAGFLRHRIAEHLDLRVVPEVRFHYDQQLQDTQHLLAVLEGLHTPEKPD